MQSFADVFKIPELRRRVLFTLGIVAIYRVGAAIPIPGINAEALQQLFAQQSNTLLGFLDIFSGGALGRLSIFSMGIMPYINSSIIMSLLQGAHVIPYLDRLAKEGEMGRKKLNQITRYFTLLLGLIQSFGLTTLIMRIPLPGDVPVVKDPNAMFIFVTVVTLTTGTIFVMWLGEQITEFGIGNGISLIIFIGIVARFPNSIFGEFQQVAAGNRTILVEIVLWLLFVGTVAGTVLLTQGMRKIPVQYAKRVVGRKIYGGQSTHIPLRVNTAGVMPIIFAQSILFIPQTIIQFFPNSDFMVSMNSLFSYDSSFYWLIYGIMIVFFTYFYTAIAFNPVDVADNMKKYGGFIPGVRPGKKTSEYIDHILTRITLPGSIFLAIIAIFPSFVAKLTNVGYDFASFFGGTSLLIVVGVALDTLQQVESHLLMRHYDGFLKSGKIRGRRRF